VALILAINPGNSHSPTLARLARELKGDELIGADSCTVALTAIKSRVPDLVLLPDKSPRGEAELLVKLRTIPGGVPTLKLPPVASADPPALAKEIRAMLTREPKAPPPPPKPAGPSPHVVAAARAAIEWMHARRGQWAAEAERAAVAVAPEPHGPYEPHAPDEPSAPYEPVDPDNSTGADEQIDVPASPARWLPRIIVAAAIVGVAGAAFWLWPGGRHVTNGGPGTALDAPEAGPPSGPGVSSTTVEPGAPSQTAAATPQTSATQQPDSAELASGWVAVGAPIDIAITRGDEALAPDGRGRIALEPGKHRLRFRNRELGYDETRTIEVRPAETTSIDLSPETTLAVTSNEPAEVLIDGTRAGETPFEGKIRLGARTVIVRSAGGERQFPLEATMKPVQLEVDFSKP
jgi:hypothetical protein